MNEVRSSIRVAVSKQRAWEVLSDLTAMGKYMPGIAEVRFTSDSVDGVGAARHCRFKDGVELFERVVEWKPKERMVLEVTECKGVPMRSNVITFSLSDEGGKTTLTQSMRYQMKGWIFAPLVEKMASGMMKKALNGALEGFKSFVEA